MTTSLDRILDPLLLTDAPSSTDLVPRVPSSTSVSDPIVSNTLAIRDSTVPVSNALAIRTSNVSASDVESMSAQIRKHLANWTILDQTKISDKEIDVLRIPTNGGYNEISARCLISYLSHNKEFLKRDRETCRGTFRSYLENGDVVDLDKLIDLSSISREDNNFIQNGAFFQNLYGFDLSLARFISSSPEFKSADIVTKQNVINGVFDFLNQSLTYLNQCIDTYQVLDEKLLVSSYNLLFLLNILNLKRSTTGRTVEDLNAVYQKLVDTIQQNIKAYHSIVDDARPTKGAVVSASSTEISALYERIVAKTEELRKQNESLMEAKQLVEEEKTNLTRMIKSGEVMELGEALDTLVLQ